MQDPRGVEAIPKSLPVFVFSGSEDPIHGEQRGLMRMVDAYRRAGIEQVEYKLYPGARHELFNETNRDAVTADLVGWLDKALASQGLERAI